MNVDKPQVLVYSEKSLNYTGLLQASRYLGVMTVSSSLYAMGTAVKSIRLSW